MKILVCGEAVAGSFELAKMIAQTHGVDVGKIEFELNKLHLSTGKSLEFCAKEISDLLKTENYKNQFCFFSELAKDFEKTIDDLNVIFEKLRCNRKPKRKNSKPFQTANKYHK